MGPMESFSVRVRGAVDMRPLYEEGKEISPRRREGRRGDSRWFEPLDGGSAGIDLAGNALRRPGEVAGGDRRGVLDAGFAVARAQADHRAAEEGIGERAGVLVAE